MNFSLKMGKYAYCIRITLYTYYIRICKHFSKFNLYRNMYDCMYCSYMMHIYNKRVIYMFFSRMITVTTSMFTEAGDLGFGKQILIENKQARM